MLTLSVCDKNGKKVDEIRVDDALAEFSPNKQAIHDYVVMCRYNRRSWTASTKTRAEVTGSGRKPWRQKGTGRARAGSLTSPLFRGGGVTFGPKPKRVYYNLPTKVRRLAFKSALACRLKEEKVFILDDLSLGGPKTKEVLELLRNMKVEGKTLFVLRDPGTNDVLSMRNLPNVTLRRTDNVNAYDILAHSNLVLTKESYAALLGMVGNERAA